MVSLIGGINYAILKVHVRMSTTGSQSGDDIIVDQEELSICRMASEDTSFTVQFSDHALTRWLNS
jgi:hypothetical protein